MHVFEKMSYSQEFCENSFDSDGENNLNSYNMTISSFNTKQNLIATDAMIVNKLREISQPEMAVCSQYINCCFGRVKNKN